MTGLATRLMLCVATTITGSACYPAFHATSNPSPLIADGVSTSIKDAINGYLNSCTANLDTSRRDAYDAHKNQYVAGVFGGVVTLATGSGAGALGVAEQKTLSGVAGVLSLGSGVVSLILVNRPAIEASEQLQRERYEAWSTMVSARRTYEAAVIAGDTTAQQIALKEFANSAIKCGLASPAPGFLDEGEIPDWVPVNPNP